MYKSQCLLTLGTKRILTKNHLGCRLKDMTPCDAYTKLLECHNAAALDMYICDACDIIVLFDWCFTPLSFYLTI